MQIVDYPIEKIKPYEKNPRKNDGAVEALKNSIKTHGFLVPIQLTPDGTILAGHTRYKAMKEMGAKTIPSIVVSDLSEIEGRSFRIVDNKIHELSFWDFDSLGEEITAIREQLDEWDPTDFGFDETTIQDLEDEFFEELLEDGQSGETEPKTMVCPHCGKEIVL